MIKKIVLMLVSALCTAVGVFPVFAANEEDRRRIIEAAEFQPNDVY